MRYLLFRDVTQNRLMASYRHFGDSVSDVSGQPIGPILKVLADQDGLDCLPLKIGPIGCPKTSVTTNLHCVKSQKRVDLELITVERTIVQYTKDKGNKIYWW